jgi:hypothetical protein
MVKVHEFDPLIYPFKIWVAITNDEKVISERFRYYDGEEFKMSTTKPDATTYYVSMREGGWIGALVVFYKREYLTMKNIAHEAVHASQLIWDYVGEESPGDECQAFLVGWIAECIEKVKLNKG